MTSILLRRKETAAVEMTALAAGAGPPAKRIATRRMLDSNIGGRDSVLLMESSDQRGNYTVNGWKRYDFTPRGAPYHFKPRKA